ncbi:MAG: hypothetical protein ABI647_07840 [Gemmatimonadota bacterium]
MTALVEPRQDFRDVVVIGGGCYGTFYAGQLEAARAKGKIAYRNVLLVDQNPSCKAAGQRLAPSHELVIASWAPFLAEFLERPAPAPGEPDDAIVPSPLMPHLMADWLEERARREWPGRTIALRPVDEPAGTPYDATGPDGTRYVSFADWICPTHCVEPHICPVIKGPRTWEMADTLRAYRRRLARARATAGPALFVTRHRAFGVGMFDVAEAREAGALLAEAGREDGTVDLLIGTISSCHGAVSLLELGAVG